MYIYIYEYFISMTLSSFEFMRILAFSKLLTFHLINPLKKFRKTVEPFHTIRSYAILCGR